MSIEAGERGDVVHWARRGFVGGLVAGVIFAMFEMIAAAVLMGPSAFFMPLRMIGAIGLGPAALEPTYPLLPAAAAGMAIHMMNSAVYGAAFGAVVAFLPAAARQRSVLLVAATLFGVLLWVVNFFVIAPIAGWRWFPDGTDHLVQFVAHAFFYGTLLGAYVGRRASNAGAPLHERIAVSRLR